MGWREILGVTLIDESQAQITQNTRNTGNGGNFAYSAEYALDSSKSTVDIRTELARVFSLGIDAQGYPVSGTLKECPIRHRGRRHVLGNILRRYLGANMPGTPEYLPDRVIEKHINEEVRKDGYDVEAAITRLSLLAPPPVEMPDPRCKCGYMPPFCGCRWGLKVGL